MTMSDGTFTRLQIFIISRFSITIEESSDECWYRSVFYIPGQRLRVQGPRTMSLSTVLLLITLCSFFSPPSSSTSSLSTDMGTLGTTSCSFLRHSPAHQFRNGKVMRCCIYLRVELYPLPATTVRPNSIKLGKNLESMKE